MLYAFRCSDCGWRRDPEIAYCRQCGGAAAAEDRETPIEDGNFYREPDDLKARFVPTPGTPASIQRRIASLQEAAAWVGRPVPGIDEVAPKAEVLDRQLAETREQRNPSAGYSAAELEAHGAATSAHMARLGSGGWQGNPAGLSGGVVRGYRHWRTKR